MFWPICLLKQPQRLLILCIAKSRRQYSMIWVWDSNQLSFSINSIQMELVITLKAKWSFARHEICVDSPPPHGQNNFLYISCKIVSNNRPECVSVFMFSSASHWNHQSFLFPLCRFMDTSAVNRDKQLLYITLQLNALFKTKTKRKKVSSCCWIKTESGCVSSRSPSWLLQSSPGLSS